MHTLSTAGKAAPQENVMDLAGKSGSRAIGRNESVLPQCFFYLKYQVQHLAGEKLGRRGRI